MRCFPLDGAATTFIVDFFRGIICAGNHDDDDDDDYGDDLSDLTVF